MSLLSDTRLWAVVAGLAFVVVLGLVVAALGLIELFAVLSGGATVLALVQAAVPYILGLAALSVVAILLVVALAALAVDAAAGGGGGETVRRLAERARESDLLRRAGLSRRL